MTLDYGFCLYGKNTDDVKAERKRRYEALTEGQKSWMNTHPLAGGLTTLLMSSGIGHITEATIPIIIDRCKRLKLFKKPDAVVPEILRPFIGLEVNVVYETTSEFEKRHKIPHVKSTEMMTRAQADADKKKMEESFEVAPSPVPPVQEPQGNRWENLKISKGED